MWLGEIGNKEIRMQNVPTLSKVYMSVTAEKMLIFHVCSKKKSHYMICIPIPKHARVVPSGLPGRCISFLRHHQQTYRGISFKLFEMQLLIKEWHIWVFTRFVWMPDLRTCSEHSFIMSSDNCKNVRSAHFSWVGHLDASLVHLEPQVIDDSCRVTDWQSLDVLYSCYTPFLLKKALLSSTVQPL